MTKHVAHLLLLWFLAIHSPVGAQQWTPQSLADGMSCYLLNAVAQRFLTDADTLSANRPVAFTVAVQEDGACTFRTAGGKAINLTIADNSGITGGALPKSVTASLGGTATAFHAESTADGYTLSTTATWKYGLFDRNSASCTASLSARIDAETGTAALIGSTDAADNCCYWILVSPAEYNGSPYARTQALERLNSAIEAVDEAKALDIPSGAKAALEAKRTSAKATYSAATSSISSISNRVTVEQINNAAAGLEQAMAEARRLVVYYAACKQEVDNAERIGGTTVSTACTTARGALALSSSTGTMDVAMNAMRLSLIGYFRQQKELSDSTDMTGMLANPSFERSTMSGWYTFQVDGSDLSSLAGIVAGGDLSGLADLISFAEFSEQSHPVLSEGANAMTGGHGSYHYATSGQMLCQPLVGLPGGDYRLSAQMFCNAGMLNAYSCYATAIVIPDSVVKEVVGDIDLTKITDMDYYIQLLTQNIGTIVGQSTMVYGSVKTKDSNVFATTEVDFRIEEGDIALAVFNGGLLPMVGADAFCADDVRLTYLQPIPLEGDVNGDRRFSIADIVTAIRLLASPDAEGFKPANGDMDGDGRITETDVEQLVEKLKVR